MTQDLPGLVVALFTVLLTAWFAVRVHKLETRVDDLEREQYSDRAYISDLKAFIYRAGLIPPERNMNP